MALIFRLALSSVMRSPPKNKSLKRDIKIPQILSFRLRPLDMFAHGKLQNGWIWLWYYLEMTKCEWYSIFLLNQASSVKKNALASIITFGVVPFKPEKWEKRDIPWGENYPMGFDYSYDTKITPFLSIAVIMYPIDFSIYFTIVFVIYRLIG